ncbi:MAG: NAD-dependent epimerase/dehydratase family protein [Anaerolineales bacterium]|nr:NAD-dependent epimerase/dehydratase family protein [Anaerolineales bacterium]
MILVTGATGFLGHSLIPQLIATGEPVRVLVRPSSDIDFLQGYDIEVAYADDIADCEAALAAAQGCRAIIHAAGLFRFWGDYDSFAATNVAGTRALLEAARQVGADRFIYISTVAVIGEPRPGVVIDECYACEPQDPYQQSKLEAEKLVRHYGREYQLPAIILRPGAFYGPWGHYAFNRLFFAEPLRGWRIMVNKGRHITFPVYVPDVARAIVQALAQGRPGETYNISDTAITHREVYDLVSDAAGISRWRLNVPTGLVVLLARAWTWLSHYTRKEPFYPINMSHYVFADWVVNSDKARCDLGFVPTPIETGVQNTVDWYRQHEFRK